MYVDASSLLRNSPFSSSFLLKSISFFGTIGGLLFSSIRNKGQKSVVSFSCSSFNFEMVISENLLNTK
jgi:hypothetical protein